MMPSVTAGSGLPILMTSAPKSASRRAAVGPATAWVMSMTRKPSRGRSSCSSSPRPAPAPPPLVAAAGAACSSATRAAWSSSSRWRGGRVPGARSRSKLLPGIRIEPSSGSSIRTTAPDSWAWGTFIHSVGVRTIENGRFMRRASSSHHSPVRLAMSSV